jgi:outer membrane protein assembly factor BamE (lipoprotein component of BamABCDE complex)
MHRLDPARHAREGADIAICYGTIEIAGEGSAHRLRIAYGLTVGLQAAVIGFAHASDTVADAGIGDAHFAQRAVHIVEECLAEKAAKRFMLARGCDAAIMQQAKLYQEQMRHDHIKATIDAIGHFQCLVEKRVSRRLHQCYIGGLDCRRRFGNKQCAKSAQHEMTPFMMIRLLLISLPLLLASCTPMVDARGHSADALDISQVVKGQTRAEDVVALLGSPTTVSGFGDETWYYITQKQERVGLFAREVTAQQVLAIQFNTDKTVREIGEFTMEEGKPVQMVSRTTPTEGHDLTFIEQMLGNLGRFNTPSRGISDRNRGR